jgi:hypothetical protein
LNFEKRGKKINFKIENKEGNGGGMGEMSDNNIHEKAFNIHIDFNNNLQL